MTKRMSVIIVVLTIVSGLIGGAITWRIFTPKVAIAEESTQSKVLTVEGLRVVDKNGKLLIELGKSEADVNSYGLAIYDSSGMPNTIISTDANGGAVVVTDNNGKPGASMRVREYGGSVNVYGKDSKSGAIFGVDANGGAVAVHDNDGNSRVMMIIGESGGNILVGSKYGKANGGTVAIHRNDGKPGVVMSIDDSSGNVLVTGNDGKTGASMQVSKYGGSVNVYGKDSTGVRAGIQVNEYGSGAITLLDKNGNSLYNSEFFSERINDKFIDKMQNSNKTHEIIGKDGAPMVLIPAGEFQMGSDDEDDEKPVHTVYIDAFYMDKYEVTNAQYKKFMDATGYKAPHDWNDPRYNIPNHPVVGISWYDAVAYCKWAGKRLPTEAEWEKAARGGLIGKNYPLGDNITNDDANYIGTGGRDIWNGTSPVGSFPPNGYGLYDMAGNVCEWCSDWYDSGYYEKSPKSNPKGPDSGNSNVVRDGSWIKIGPILRLANRGYLEPTSNDSIILGFRCVQDVPK